MDPADCHFRLCWQAADEVEIRASGKDPAGLSPHEQLGYVACFEPFAVGGDDRSHVGGLALDRDLPGPCQGRAAPLAWFGEWPSVVGHLLVGESAQDRLRQDLLDEEVVSQNHLLTSLGT